MKLWDVIAGRSRPKAPNLDSLFLVPSAAITLQTTLGLHPTGDGSVCYRGSTGSGFASTERDAVDLLRADPEAPEVRLSTDGYGFSWLEIDREPGADVGGLCTGLHSVNTGLEAAGYGSALLCTVVTFEGAGRHVGLVYLYKQGTFYAYCPVGEPGDAQREQRRDNLLEIQIRDALAAELPMEPQMSRWLALWGAPGL